VKIHLPWFATAALLVALPASCSLINAPDEVRAGVGGSGEGGDGGTGATGSGGSPSSSSSGTGGSTQCTVDIDCAALNNACATHTCEMGTCSGSNAPDGTPCDDGQFCTQADTCEAGQCKAGAEPACKSSNACETVACDEGADMCSVTVNKFCASGDGCCPAGCTSTNDNDCVYWASGVQQDVPPQALVGWTQCHTSTYAGSAPLPDVLAQCNKARLLLACRPVGAANFTLLAMAPRADVLHDCGTETTCVHQANGAGWYFDESSSWGFAPGGEPVNRSSCDYNANMMQTLPHLRMCWHTSADTISAGYRCGDLDLNGNTSWERFVFHAD